MWCNIHIFAPPTNTNKKMATVTAFIRVSSKKVDRANVRFRLRDGRNLQFFYKSDIEVNPAHWDPSKQEIKSKVVYDNEKRAEFNTSVSKMKGFILSAFNSVADKDNLTSELLEIEIDKAIYPEKYELKVKPQTFYEVFNEFIAEKKISEVRKSNYRVVLRALQRYELYKRLTGSHSFQLSFDSISPAVLRDIERFLFEEHKYFESHPEIYKAVPETRTPAPRGQNTINGIFTKLRTLFIWANQAEKTTANPFRTFKIKEDTYGTPYYITVEERNRLYKTNLSRHPKLAIQRDIFVFQCLIGCRFGDLSRMTKSNRINGAIEYIARKTRDGRPVTVRVPLNTIAKEILDRYNNHDELGLLPFISEQKYNVAIKRMFQAARLNRPVTILNPTTGNAEIKPLNEIASSHLARRCFIGNLYKQVKDPNLVGALSGHKEGSKAFVRYREIDEEMKKDLVNLLE
jgi:site-specific recombinase XerD